eukprot:983668_1
MSQPLPVRKASSDALKFCLLSLRAKVEALDSSVTDAIVLILKEETNDDILLNTLQIVTIIAEHPRGRKSFRGEGWPTAQDLASGRVHQTDCHSQITKIISDSVTKFEKRTQIHSTRLIIESAKRALSVIMFGTTIRVKIESCLRVLSKICLRSIFASVVFLNWICARPLE